MTFVKTTQPGAAQPSAVLDASAGAVRLPEGLSLFDAQFVRIGPDLALVTESGETVVVRGFFAAAAPPNLIDVAGAQVSGALASQLAGPPAPGQYGPFGDGGPMLAIGQVDAVDGAASATRADGTVVQLHVGEPVFRGDVLATDADSALGVLFADSGVLSIGADSRVVLEEMVYDGGGPGAARFSVQDGLFVYVSGAIANADPDAVVISTPVGSIGVRGGAIGISYAAGAQSLAFNLIAEADGALNAPSTGGVVLLDSAEPQVFASAGTFVSVQSDAVSVHIMAPAVAAQIFQSAKTSTLAASAIAPSFLSADGDEQAAALGEMVTGASGEKPPTTLEQALDAPVPVTLGITPTAPMIRMPTVETIANGFAPADPAAAIIEHDKYAKLLLEGYAPAAPLAADANEAPFTLDDHLEIDQDTARSINVLANDHDPDSDAPLLLDTINTFPFINGAPLHPIFGRYAGSVVTAHSDGVVSFDPAGHFTALGVGEAETVLFNYTAKDVAGDSSSQNIFVTITGKNDRPVATDDAFTTDEDAVSLDAEGALANLPFEMLLWNDYDPDTNDIVSFLEFDKGDLRGHLEDVGTGFTYSPHTLNESLDFLAAGEVYVDSARYRITDEWGLASNWAEITFTVTGINDAPVARNEVAYIVKDAGDIPILVLANDDDMDSDDDGASLKVVSASAASGASIEFSGEAGDWIVYKPSGMVATATDSISYTIEDRHGAQAEGSVTVKVLDVGEMPNEDVIFDGNALADKAPDPDQDPEGSPLTILPGEVVSALGAKVTISADGSFQYDPTQAQAQAVQALGAGRYGVDAFTYLMSDGSSGGSVTLTVRGENDAPVLTSPLQITTNEDAETLDIDLLDGVRDIDATDKLMVTDFSSTGGEQPDSLKQAAAKLIFEAADYAYLAAGEQATLSFAYTVSDGFAHVDQTLTVTILGVNDAPVAINDRAVTDSLSAVRIAVMTNDRDPDANDAFDLISVNGQQISGESPVTLGSGAIVSINPDGTLTYDPNGTFGGVTPGAPQVDEFAYTLIDSQGAATEARVNVTFYDPNDPRPDGGEILTSFETLDPLTDWLPLGWRATASPGSAASLSDLPVHVGERDPSLGAGAGPSHLDRFAVIESRARTSDESNAIRSLSDLETELGLEAGAVARALDASPHAASPRALYTDVWLSKGDVLSFDWTFVSGEPTADHDDFAAFTVATTHGSPFEAPSVAQVFKITDVAAVADATGQADGAWGTLTSAYTHTGPSGLYRIGFSVFDEGSSANNSKLIVDNVRIGADLSGFSAYDADKAFQTLAEPPTARPDDLQANEDQILSLDLDRLLANDWKPFEKVAPAADRVLKVGPIAAGGGQTVLASGAVLALTADGTVTYDPRTAFDHLAEGEIAQDTFTYTLAEPSGAQDVGSVTVTITGANDKPTVAQPLIIAIDDQTAPLTIDLLADAQDVDIADLLSVFGFAQADGPELSLMPDGSTLAFDPGAYRYLGAGESIVFTYSYDITDGREHTNQSVTIIVEGTNDAPVAREDAFAASEDEAIAGNVLDDNGGGVDSDVDAGDALSVQHFEGLSVFGARVTMRADGSFDYDPGSAVDVQALRDGETAEDSFSYTLTDSHGAEAAGTARIGLTGLNDAPVAQFDAFETFEDTPISFSKGAFLVNDHDPDAGDVLSFDSVDAIGTRGSLTVIGDAVIYDPRGAYPDMWQSQSAIDTFRYTVRDEAGAVTTGEVAITVHGRAQSRLVDSFEMNPDGAGHIFQWQSSGHVHAVSTHADDGPRQQGYDPPDGQRMVELVADPMPQGSLKTFLGLSDGVAASTLKDLPRGSLNGDGSIATDGAAIKASISMEPGDVLSFDYFFDALEYLGVDKSAYNDFALFVADGEAFRIMDVRNQVDLSEAFGTLDGTFGAVEGIGFYRYHGDAPAELSIGFAAFDDGYDSGTDLTGDSRLLIDNIRINRENPDQLGEGYTIVDNLSNDQFQVYAAHQA